MGSVLNNGLVFYTSLLCKQLDRRLSCLMKTSFIADETSVIKEILITITLHSFW